MGFRKGSRVVFLRADTRVNGAPEHDISEGKGITDDSLAATLGELLLEWLEDLDGDIGCRFFGKRRSESGLQSGSGLGSRCGWW